jgi:hypothetical protein
MKKQYGLIPPPHPTPESKPGHPSWLEKAFGSRAPPRSGEPMRPPKIDRARVLNMQVKAKQEQQQSKRVTRVTLAGVTTTGGKVVDPDGFSAEELEEL